MVHAEKMLNNKNNAMRASESKVDAVVFRDAATIRPPPTDYAGPLIDGYVPRNIKQMLSLGFCVKSIFSMFRIYNL